MASRDQLISIATKEVGNGVRTNSKRISEYFSSYPQYANKSEQAMLKISWCQLFLNWALLKAGYPTFQRTYAEWMKNAKDNKDDGFQYMFRSKGSGYKPRPGDIYYSPLVGNKKTEHMGFILKDYGGGRYKTLDGNAGGVGHPMYDKTLWTGQKFGNLVGGLGGGIVCINERHDNGGANVGIVGFIEIPPMFRLKL